MLIDTGGITAPFDFIDKDKYTQLSEKMSKDLTSLILSWDDEEDEPTTGLKKVVPIWEKFNLTLEESSDYFGIGINRLRKMSEDEKCPYVLHVGSKRLIIRIAFENYLAKAYSI